MVRVQPGESRAGEPLARRVVRFPREPIFAGGRVGIPVRIRQPEAGRHSSSVCVSQGFSTLGVRSCNATFHLQARLIGVPKGSIFILSSGLVDELLRIRCRFAAVQDLTPRFGVADGDPPDSALRTHGDLPQRSRVVG